MRFNENHFQGDLIKGGEFQLPECNVLSRAELWQSLA